VEGGGGVIGGFTWLVQDHPICVFEGGRVVSEVNQGGDEVK